MFVGERLHHIVCRYGRARNLLTGNDRAAFHAKADVLVRRNRRNQQCHAHLVAAGRQRAADQREIFGSVLQTQGNLAGEPVFAQGKNGEGKSNLLNAIGVPKVFVTMINIFIQTMLYSLIVFIIITAALRGSKV